MANTVHCILFCWTPRELTQAQRETLEDPYYANILHLIEDDVPIDKFEFETPVDWEESVAMGIMFSEGWAVDITSWVLFVERPDYNPKFLARGDAPHG